MVLMHENDRLGTQCLHINALGCLLNIVGWKGSQVNAHAKALLGTVNTASLNLATVQGGPIGRSPPSEIR